MQAHRVLGVDERERGEALRAAYRDLHWRFHPSRTRDGGRVLFPAIDDAMDAMAGGSPRADAPAAANAEPTHRVALDGDDAALMRENFVASRRRKGDDRRTLRLRVHVQRERTILLAVPAYARCVACAGHGSSGILPCATCSGSGLEPVEHSLPIEVRREETHVSLRRFGIGNVRLALTFSRRSE